MRALASSYACASSSSGSGGSSSNLYGVVVPDDDCVEMTLGLIAWSTTNNLGQSRCFG